MSEQAEGTVEFALRMSERLKHVPDGAEAVMTEVADLQRLIEHFCVTEAQKEARQQRAFQAICDSGVQFYEA